MGQGKVWLVGAGPGDAEWLTLKAARVLAACEVWLIDDLVDKSVLELAGPQTRVVRVGKRGGCKSTPQAFILRLMLRYARQGRSVTRVKGGDPFVFGRGGEEWAWLAERGVEVDAVAGVSAGLALGAALGLPLTHRQTARGVALVTAHTTDGTRPNWQALAQSALTLVIYMGMQDVEALQAELQDAGLPEHTPVLVAERVGCAGARSRAMVLGTLARSVHEAGLASPALVVVGEVAVLAARLGQEAADRRCA